MKEPKIDLKEINKENKQKAINIINKTKKSLTKIADQNDDGKFDKEDIIKVTNTIKTNIDEKAKEIEIKKLQPIFPADIDDGDFLIQKFIRVADRDKKRSESEVCKGSIGYFTSTKGIRLLNIFRDSIDFFGLSFYPDSRSEFYYVDPSDRDRYIALDDYFNYLKAERISELQRIAQDLGAKHFKVTFVEEKSSYTGKKINAHGKITNADSLDITSNKEDEKYSKIEIAAENDFPGKAR